MRPSLFKGYRLVFIISVLVLLCVLLLTIDSMRRPDSTTASLPPPSVAESPAILVDTSQHTTLLSQSDGDIPRLEESISRKTKSEMRQIEEEVSWALRHDMLPGMEWIDGPDGYTLRYLEESFDGNFEAVLAMPTSERPEYRRIFFRRYGTQDWKPVGDFDRSGVETLIFRWTSDNKQILSLERKICEPLGEATSQSIDVRALRASRTEFEWIVNSYDVSTGATQNLFYSTSQIYDISPTSDGKVLIAVRSPSDFNDVELLTVEGDRLQKQAIRVGDVEKVRISSYRNELWYEAREFDNSAGYPRLTKIDIARVAISGERTEVPQVVVENAQLGFCDRNSSQFVFIPADTNEIWLGNADSSQVRQLYSGFQLATAAGFSSNGQRIEFYGHRNGEMPGNERIKGSNTGMGLFSAPIGD